MCRSVTVILHRIMRKRFFENLSTPAVGATVKDNLKKPSFYDQVIKGKPKFGI